MVAHWSEKVMNHLTRMKDKPAYRFSGRSDVL